MARRKTFPGWNLRYPTLAKPIRLSARGWKPRSLASKPGEIHSKRPVVRHPPPPILATERPPLVPLSDVRVGSSVRCWASVRWNMREERCWVSSIASVEPRTTEPLNRPATSQLSPQNRCRPSSPQAYAEECRKFVLPLCVRLVAVKMPPMALLPERKSRCKRAMA
jgi:hypothetical protein